MSVNIIIRSMIGWILHCCTYLVNLVAGIQSVAMVT